MPNRIWCDIIPNYNFFSLEILLALDAVLCGTVARRMSFWSIIPWYVLVNFISEIIRSKKEFFQKLQMKIKEKCKNNNEHKGSGRNHTARYSKLQILPNDIDDGSDDEDVLYKRLWSHSACKEFYWVVPFYSIYILWFPFPHFYVIFSLVSQL